MEKTESFVLAISFPKKVFHILFRIQQSLHSEIFSCTVLIAFIECPGRMGPIKVKKPQAILFDLSGTATKSYFTDKILFPYIKHNCSTYLFNNWDNQILQKDITRLREQSKKDEGPKIFGPECDREEIERSICQYVFKCLNELRENDAINIFRLHMWFDGYNRNKIETPVYSDVAIQIKHWRITQNIKLYVLSNGWVEATKRFMAKTNHGDLNLLIDGHFDSTSGPLDDPNTFRRVVEQISLPPTQVLFLTKSPSENKAALEAGLNSILVMTHRRDLARLDDKMKKNICYVRSFNEITFIEDRNAASMPSESDSNLNSSLSKSRKSKNSKCSIGSSSYDMSKSRSNAKVSEQNDSTFSKNTKPTETSSSASSKSSSASTDHSSSASSNHSSSASTKNSGRHTLNDRK
ncbi:hypothetical protein NH340_JMT07753 [Sarcoptes scabiei]|nr:hypothetical protein NH340_JMT07753 [Sarcoptes scabiei]